MRRSSKAQDLSSQVDKILEGVGLLHFDATSRGNARLLSSWFFARCIFSRMTVLFFSCLLELSPH